MQYDQEINPANLVFKTFKAPRDKRSKPLETV